MNWLRQLKKGFRSSKSNALSKRRLGFEEAARTPKGRTMRLEHLEDRLLLAVVYCNSASDLQQAVVSAGDNGVIRIYGDLTITSEIHVGFSLPGYTGATGIPLKNVTLQGWSTGNDSGQAQQRTITFSGSGAWNTHDQVTFNNFTFVGTTSANSPITAGSWSNGKGLTSRPYLTFNSCNFGTSTTALKGNKAGAVWFYNTQNGGWLADTSTSVKTLKMNNCNFYSCCASTAADSAGAIYNREGTTILDTCTFTLCGSSGANSGGAIYNRGTTTLDNCSFTLCGSTTALSNGGAVYNYQNAVLTIQDNCQFINCDASSGGGAIFGQSGSTITMTGGKFQGCASGSGGSLFLSSGTFSFTDVTFDGNQATNMGGGGYVASDATFTNCTFKENLSTNQGGGIYIAGGTTTFKGSTFSKNYSTNSEGGAICIAAATCCQLQVYDNGGTKTGCSFTENYSAGGGAISVRGRCVVTGTSDCGMTFSGNYCTTGYGGAFYVSSSSGEYYYGKLIGDYVTIKDHYADLGGAIFAKYAGAYVELNHSSLTGNHINAQKAGSGGAIYGQLGAAIRLDNSVLKGNSTGTSGNGGAIFVETKSNITANCCSIIQNVAKTSGGAVFIDAYYTGSSNTASANCGSGNFYNCILAGNKAEGYTTADNGVNASGGAIFVNRYHYVYSSTTQFRFCATVTLYGCIIAGNYGNSADGVFGGAVITVQANYTADAGYARIYNCTFAGNTGGDFYNLAGGGEGSSTRIFSIYNTLFTGAHNIHTLGSYNKNVDASAFKSYTTPSSWSETGWQSWDLTLAYTTTVLGQADANYLDILGVGSAFSDMETFDLTSPSAGYTYVVLASNGKGDLGAVQRNFQKTLTVTSTGSGKADDSLNNFMTLINAKQSDATQAHTISFADNITSLSFTSEMVINYNITLSGTTNSDGSNKVTLTSNGDTRIFAVAGNNGALTVNNINFAHAGTKYSYNGGAICAIKPLTLNHCSFTGFSATNRGGALNTSDTLSITDCTFTNNATSGDASSSYGGAIAVSGGTVTLAGTNTFSGNSAVRGGAVSVESGTFTISSGTTTFSSNSATTSGGAIHSIATVTTSGAAFSGNHVDGGSGGAIYTEGTLSVTGGTFTGNYASKQGGAIMSKAGITVSGATFGKSGSSSDANHAVNGGAIFLTGSANSTIDNDSKFYYNYVTTRGGAIYTQTTGTVTINGTFDRNGQNGATDGGAIAASRGTVTLSGTFTNNKAASSGGAVYVQGVSGANVTLNSSANYTSNVAAYGGAIRTGNYSKLNVTGGTFASNTAKTSTDSNGGAILNWSGDASSITNATFTSNSASNAGGAIANFAALSVTNCNIGSSGGNSAKYGGGIYTSGALTLSGTTISKNTASFNGGGVSVGSVTVSGTTTYGSITAGANDSVISGNTASNRGGGLLIGGSSKSAHGTVGTPGAGYIRVYSNTSDDIMSAYISTADLNKAHITTKASAAALPNTPMMASVMSNLEAITVQEGASAVLPASGTYLYDIDNDGVYDYQSDSVLTSAELAALGYTPGTYEITVALADADGNPDEEFTYKSTLTVEEAAAPNVACETNSFANGQILALNLAVSGNAATIAQWTINWGDGQTSVIDSLADSISATHAYTAEGTFDVTLQMVDTNGNGAGTWVYLTTHTFGTAQEAEAAALPVEISVTDAAIAETAAKAEIALYWDNAEKEDAFALEIPAAAAAVAFEDAQDAFFAEIPALESAAPTLDLTFAVNDANDDEDESDQLLSSPLF